MNINLLQQIVTIIFTVVFSSSCAYPEDKMAELINDPLSESFNPEVKVSGNVIVGVMSESALDALTEKDALKVSASSFDGQKEICLKTVTIDGVYSSANTYKVTKNKNILPYYEKSKHKKEIENFHIDDLAMIATDGSCETQNNNQKYFFLVNKNQNPGSILVYINGFDARDVSIKLSGSNDNAKTCEMIKGKKNTAYNFKCELEINAKESELSAIIYRERFGRELTPVTIKIVRN